MRPRAPAARRRVAPKTIREPACILWALLASASWSDPGAAWSFLDCPADLPQVLAERVRRVVGAAGQVLIERSLRTQCLAGREPRCLLAFDLPDCSGGVEHLIKAVRSNE